MNVPSIRQRRASRWGWRPAWGTSLRGERGQPVVAFVRRATALRRLRAAPKAGRRVRPREKAWHELPMAWLDLRPPAALRPFGPEGGRRPSRVALAQPLWRHGQRRPLALAREVWCVVGTDMPAGLASDVAPG